MTGISITRKPALSFGICRREAVQTDLFDKLDRGRRRVLIRAVDEINRKNGHNAVKVAALGTGQKYASERQYVSRRYTTTLDEVLVVKV